MSDCNHSDIYKGWCKKCGGALTAEELWVWLNQEIEEQLGEKRPKKLSRTVAKRLWTLDLKKEFGIPLPGVFFLQCTCKGRTALGSSTWLQERFISTLWMKYLREHPDSLYGVTPDQALEHAHAPRFLGAKPSKDFLKWLHKQYEWMELKTGQVVEECKGCQAVRRYLLLSKLSRHGIKKHLEDAGYYEDPPWGSHSSEFRFDGQEEEIEHHTYGRKEAEGIEDLWRMKARRARVYVSKLVRTFAIYGIDISRLHSFVRLPCLNGCGRWIRVVPAAGEKKQSHQHKLRLRKIEKGMREWFCDDCYRERRLKTDRERVKARRHEKALQEDITFFKKRRKRLKRGAPRTIIV